VKGTNADTLSNPRFPFSDGTHLIISDAANHRVLVFNKIPLENGISADAVIGQQNFTGNQANQGGSADANTLKFSGDSTRPGVCIAAGKIFIADSGNNRVLIFNGIPNRNNASADVVLGQTNFTNTGTGTSATTLSNPHAVWCDGNRVYVADRGNHRILIWNSIPITNGKAADVVVGQDNFTTGTSAGSGVNHLNRPYRVFSDGVRMIVSDRLNNRVLIWNSISTTNGQPADVVIGQKDFNSSTANQGAGVNANTLSGPHGVFYDGKRLYIGDNANNRVLIYNSLPSQNNASADIVLGQPDFTSSSAYQGGDPAANNFSGPEGITSDGRRLFIADTISNRVLIFNIGGSTNIPLGPQFEQGKAVLGKVFNDRNSNGQQDAGEEGIAGVKVASDTGIYAITDEDGKFHYPYIEVGQRLLKVDSVTLPEGSTFTTDNPYRLSVTEGVLSKVSFGVKLPETGQGESPSNLNKKADGDSPLLKVSITQDPVLIKPRLSLSATLDKEKAVFVMDCNYFLFLESAEIRLYDSSYRRIKTLPLSKPFTSRYTFPRSDLPELTNASYYQLFVYDKEGREDRASVGRVEVF
jgi:hypothetical protein